MTPPTTHRDHADAWRRHRRWRWLPLSVIGVGSAFAVAAGRWPAPQPLVATAQWPFVLLSVATMIFTHVQVARFACPRCGERFNAWRLDGAGLRADAGKACVHCHLPLYG
jgi:hypothetical protein